MKISAVKEWRPAAVKQQIRMDVPMVKTDVKTKELHNVTRRSFKLHTENTLENTNKINL